MFRFRLDGSSGVPRPRAASRAGRRPARRPPAAHRPARGPGRGAARAEGVVHYQPAGRFWSFQFIEAGIFVALTAAALGATIWLLRRRASWAA
jgi:hypothetical protein